jgi:hypothetical protein
LITVSAWMTLWNCVKKGTNSYTIHTETIVRQWIFIPLVNFLFENQPNVCLSRDIWPIYFIYPESFLFPCDFVCVLVTFTRHAVTEDELQLLHLLLVEYRLTTLVKNLNAARFIPVNECFKLTGAEHHCLPERQQVLVKTSYCILFMVESTVCDFYTALKAECWYFSFHAMVSFRVTRDPNWFWFF